MEAFCSSAVEVFSATRSRLSNVCDSPADLAHEAEEEGAGSIGQAGAQAPAVPGRQRISGPPLSSLAVSGAPGAPVREVSGCLEASSASVPAGTTPMAVGFDAPGRAEAATVFFSMATPREPPSTRLAVTALTTLRRESSTRKQREPPAVATAAEFYSLFTPREASLPATEPAAALATQVFSLATPRDSSSWHHPPPRDRDLAAAPASEGLALVGRPDFDTGTTAQAERPLTVHAELVGDQDDTWAHGGGQDEEEDSCTKARRPGSSGGTKTEPKTKAHGLCFSGGLAEEIGNLPSPSRATSSLPNEEGAHLSGGVRTEDEEGMLEDRHRIPTHPLDETPSPDLVPPQKKSEQQETKQLPDWQALLGDDRRLSRRSGRSVQEGSGGIGLKAPIGASAGLGEAARQHQRQSSLDWQMLLGDDRGERARGSALPKPQQELSSLRDYRVDDDHRSKRTEKQQHQTWEGNSHKQAWPQGEEGLQQTGADCQQQQQQQAPAWEDNWPKRAWLPMERASRQLQTGERWQQTAGGRWQRSGWGRAGAGAQRHKDGGSTRVDAPRYAGPFQ